MAKMPTPGQTVPASSANDMAFTCHGHAGLKIDHMTSHRFNDADKLVADLHRRRNSPLRPTIPFIDVDIGTANGRTENPDQNIELADRRHRDFLQPKPRTTLSFDERLHRFHGD